VKKLLLYIGTEAFWALWMRPFMCKLKILSKGRNKKLSEHFMQHEADCSCDNPRCFFTIINDKVVASLEATRAAVFGGKRFSPTSWMRCQTWNEQVGGVNRSRHCKGDACDIPIPASMNWYEFEYRLNQIWDQVIVYKNKRFAHCAMNR